MNNKLDWKEIIVAVQNVPDIHASIEIECPNGKNIEISEVTFLKDDGNNKVTMNKEDFEDLLAKCVEFGAVAYSVQKPGFET
jgi:hypothetical protein